MASPVLPIDMLSDSLRRRYLADAGTPTKPPSLPADPSIPAGLSEVDRLLGRVADSARLLNPPFDELAPLDRYLGTAAATAAGFHLLTVEHLLTEGVCGLQAAAAARAMFDNALLWAWVDEDRPAREPAIGRVVVDEWDRLIAAAVTGCGIGPDAISRWRPASEAELQRFRSVTAPPDGSEILTAVADGSMAGPAAQLLRFEGLTVAAAVLAECSHFNRFAALYAPIPTHPRADGVVGPFDVGGRLVGEVHAVVAHVAAVSFAATCVVTAGLHPGPLHSLPIEEIAGRAISVTSAAAKVHGLGGAVLPPGTLRIARGSPPGRGGTVRMGGSSSPTEARAVVAVREAGARMFDDLYAAAPAICVVHPVSRVRCVVLPLYASALWALRTVAHETNVTTIAAFAGRQLVEEASRWDWASEISVDEDERVDRLNGLFKDMRRSRRRILRAATDSPLAHPLLRPFVFPGGYDVLDLASGSVRGADVPMSPAQCLANIRVVGPEGPGWLITAYSVLSQVTHQTPLGVIHGYHNDGTGRSAGWLSPPMEALAIDTAATAAARLLWCMGPILIGAVRGVDNELFDQDAFVQWREVARQRAAEVHDLAAPVHGIFGQAHLPFSRLGRNAPCLCDSGRKSKQCHGVRV